MLENDEGKKINFTTFKSLVGSLRYLSCTHLDILFGVEFVSRFMKTPIMTLQSIAGNSLRYIKAIIDFCLFYDYSSSFELVGYSDSNWAIDMNNRKSTTSFILYMGDTTFTWNSQKYLQSLCQHVKLNMQLLHYLFVIAYS